MALRKALTHRFLNMAKICSSPQIRIPQTPSNHPSLFHKLVSNYGKRPIFQSAVPLVPLSLPTGDMLIERICELNGDRIRLDGLTPLRSAEKEEEGVEKGVSMEEVKKVLRASQMEAARARLRAIPGSSISYSEFFQICCDVSSVDQGFGIARSLDDSGDVIVLGNVVFLRPDQVAKAIERVLPLSMSHQNDPQRKELREMEEKAAEIDNKAQAEVKRELWCGLGFLVLQTVGFMRLTFWELSWDVMEPICFFVTSIYFMAGYSFFLKTSKDPSFEGFFQCRFAAKQKRLMKAYNFDLNKFNELRRSACHLPPPPSEEFASSSYFDCHRRSNLLGVVH